MKNFSPTKIIALFALIASCAKIIAAQSQSNHFVQTYTRRTTFAYPTLTEWHTACDKLPYYRTTKTNYRNKPTLLSVQEVEGTIDEFKATMRSQLELNYTWVDYQAPSPEYLSTPTFKPFAQKVVLPTGSHIAFHGDLHGDVHALVAYLVALKKNGYLDDNFTITNPCFYIVFLGDYVDRGNFGIEVIYTLLRLKLANPDKVFLIRGNHETVGLNTRYGFYEEIMTKFPTAKNVLIRAIAHMYELMPVVLYLGSQSHLLQCNHGGMELGYLPHKLLHLPGTIGFEWVDKLNRKTNGACLSTEARRHISTLDKRTGRLHFNDFTPSDPDDIGFLWNDFLVSPKTFVDYIPGRGWGYGKRLTQELLAASSTQKQQIVGVFRAHQHAIGGDMMHLILHGITPGVGKLWDQKPKEELWKGIIATFNVTPDSSYGIGNNFNFDTYGLLTIGTCFPQDWKFKIYNLKP